MLDVLNYFSFFDYPPTFEDIHTFLKKRTSKQALVSILKKMEKKSLVKSWKIDDGGWKIEDRSLRLEDRKCWGMQNLFQPSTFNHLSSAVNVGRYTLGEYGKNIKYQKSKIKNSNESMKQWSNYEKRYQISKNKLNSLRFKLYICLVSLFPQIKLVGLSGSVAMLNADEGHDIDLFIVTAKNRLFTGRFIALFLAQLLGIRRKRAQINQSRSEVRKIRSQTDSDNSDVSDLSDLSGIRLPIYSDLSDLAKKVSSRVCLNLFFDESDLSVPDSKRSDYVGHEVLQMKPLIQKDNAYMMFIDANRWVFDIFPNAKKIVNSQLLIVNRNQNQSINNQQLTISNKLGLFLEQLFKSLQLHSIKKHTTTEIITNTQLWFHPEDFAKKLKKLKSTP